MLKLFFALSALMLATACQSLGLKLANFSNDSSQYSIARDVTYGEQDWHKLDVYTPKAKAETTYPVVVFFYGGSWSSGKKEQYQFVADTLTRKGFVVVIPDYVKYPQAKYPAFVEDAALASRWLKDNVAQYGGNAQRMHLLGHSAGAHTAAMLLSDARFLQAQQLKPAMYNSFVGLAGPYDFVPKAEKYKKIFGPPENFPNMVATNFIDGTEPPMLLLHGLDDNIVLTTNLERFSKRINDSGGIAQTKLYKGIGHLLIVGSFSPTIDFNNTIVQDTVTFMQKYDTSAQ